MFYKMIDLLKVDKDKRLLFFSIMSIILCLAFAIFNGILGIVYNSLWNGCICIYYIFLIMIKILIVFGGKITYYDNKTIRKNIIVIFSFILLLFINIAMITPAALMLFDKRSYNYGIIIGIIMATYTTYSITMAIINLKRTIKVNNIFVKQIRLINMITALMSLLILQNTLIVANGGYDRSMTVLSFWTSLGIIFLVLVMIIISFIMYVKNYNKNN
ncbi:MAG: hypothetical protein K5892_07140 [Acholeplasmatales bacterium]|nr:hypothetical protein [Acholeplasmatales bacterium]